jgi:hypothetical protein
MPSIFKQTAWLATLPFHFGKWDITEQPERDENGNLKTLYVIEITPVLGSSLKNVAKDLGKIIGKDGEYETCTYDLEGTKVIQSLLDMYGRPWSGTIERFNAQDRFNRAMDCLIEGFHWEGYLDRVTFEPEDLKHIKISWLKDIDVSAKLERKAFIEELKEEEEEEELNQDPWAQVNENDDHDYDEVS